MNVPIGWQSIIGWGTFVASTIATANIAIAEHSAELSGPGKWTAILGLVSFVTTAAGRYLQSHKMIGSTPSLLPFATGLIGRNAQTEPLSPPPES